MMSISYDLQVILASAIVILSVILIRMSICMPSYRKYRRRRDRKGKVPTLIFFGSGGHTTEMIHLTKKLCVDNYGPFYFVISHSDTTSKGKINSANLPFEKSALWKTVYRSREVKQPWLSTAFTTVRSLFQSFYMVVQLRPELIICNGPGTCVPICYSAFFLRVIAGPILGYEPVIIFAESFCRVANLSLTGKLLYPIADRFVVQWPQLASKYPRAEYLGRIC